MILLRKYSRFIKSGKKEIEERKYVKNQMYSLDINQQILQSKQLTFVSKINIQILFLS